MLRRPLLVLLVYRPGESDALAKFAKYADTVLAGSRVLANHAL